MWKRKRCGASDAGARVCVNERSARVSGIPVLLAVLLYAAAYSQRRMDGAATAAYSNRQSSHCMGGAASCSIRTSVGLCPYCRTLVSSIVLSVSVLRFITALCSCAIYALCCKIASTDPIIRDNSFVCRWSTNGAALGVRLAVVVVCVRVDLAEQCWIRW